MSDRFSRWKSVDSNDPAVAMCDAYWGHEIEETDIVSDHSPDDMEVDDDAMPLHPKAINVHTDFDSRRTTPTSVWARMLMREEYRKALEHFEQLLDEDTTGTEEKTGVLVTGQPGIGKLSQYYGHNSSSQ